MMLYSAKSSLSGGSSANSSTMSRATPMPASSSSSSNPTSAISWRTSAFATRFSGTNAASVGVPKTMFSPTLMLL